jgi:ornithine cyclodeaminase/alanine dehydrogenase-like protein (mu-crystallin family)
MRVIDAAAIRRALTFPILVDALEAAHRRPKMEAQDGFLGSEQELYFVRSAIDRGRFMVSKLITSFPANLDDGTLPAVQAVVVLFDGTNGKPLAVIDGTELTYWRTAADSALGARLLARPDIETLLVVGAGEMSKWLARAHTAVRPSIKRVLIWNRSATRAADVAALLAREGIAAVAATDLDAATRQADLITTCTRAHAPLVKGVNLAAGVHLDLVGGYTPQTRESDDECMRRALIFVDCRESALGVVGDLTQPIESGAITEDAVLGDLYDLVPGTIEGRRAADDITLFKNAGGGHLDLMTAETVYRLVADGAA